ncbi:conserved hypothetical protein [Hyphomicrobiales bacterium]|nr:conserved hypothetical protein [Hyphomicrobiales bacterium]CAH1674356.1 conserved hypothetical protein [Hyphomicrobiales bacterium]
MKKESSVVSRGDVTMIKYTIDVINEAGAEQALLDLVLADFATAFQAWSSVLTANITLSVRFEILNQTISGRFQGGPASTLNIGKKDGLTVWEGAASYELRTGLNSGKEYDILVQANINHLRDAVYFGSNIEPDKVSAVSTIVHELGHGIGFVGWRDDTTGLLPGDYQSPFDSHIIMKDDLPYFDGVNAIKAYGGLVPLTQGNLFHLGNSAPKPGADLVDDLMNGVVFKFATDYPISDLDLAILADLGIGTRNSDILAAPLSGQMLNAGAGFDTITFDAGSVDYTFSYIEDTLAVSGQSAPYSATIAGAERITFTDRILALDIDGHAGQSYRIYKAALDRSPDAAGLTFWTAAMDDGMSLTDLAYSFVSSPEFVARYGQKPTNERYVQLLYENILGRQTDEAGYDFWVGAMDDGLTMEDLLLGFSESLEGKAVVIGEISNGIWLNAQIA